ncbi:DNA-binding transcription factor, phosphate starvation genes Pho7 [Schizosaccharomyces pombe]|uniref:Uncharacterized transcriptional regulatory protein C27B12.11c n=2 Tax=Schizosaccharomyces pombe (strain 972 / ATCC 24843) TaxID=284812 RepID=YBCB_SCHPO|nr:putative transcription factor [Schizosaccharomyces pombe]O13658.1 RecName: Full=Uncharacterized transcriptional regulatory protein C27B12.11c [Schizosaccharomyces pombe 972h-]BAA21449.1 pi067 [Schizosaccharomyces pombe]CAA16906.1 transcription factor (predicted) [Schizosaccharomyces pombe]|eukprot:NP_595543.1 putative transcription factor [Schizosaccharomyces pombe]
MQKKVVQSASKNEELDPHYKRSSVPFPYGLPDYDAEYQFINHHMQQLLTRPVEGTHSASVHPSTSSTSHISSPSAFSVQNPNPNDAPFVGNIGLDASGFSSGGMSEYYPRSVSMQQSQDVHFQNTEIPYYHRSPSSDSFSPGVVASVNPNSNNSPTFYSNPPALSNIPIPLNNSPYRPEDAYFQLQGAGVKADINPYNLSPYSQYGPEGTAYSNAQAHHQDGAPLQRVCSAPDPPKTSMPPFGSAGSPSPNRSLNVSNNTTPPLSTVNKIIKKPKATTGKVKKRLPQAKRACAKCQKDNKKCDDARPCQRCIKAKTDCIDLPRKKRPTGVRRGPYKKLSDTSNNTKSTTASSGHSTQDSLSSKMLDPSSDNQFAMSSRQMDENGMAQYPSSAIKQELNLQPQILVSSASKNFQPNVTPPFAVHHDHFNSTSMDGVAVSNMDETGTSSAGSKPFNRKSRNRSFTNPVGMTEEHFLREYAQHSVANPSLLIHQIHGLPSEQVHGLLSHTELGNAMHNQPTYNESSIAAENVNNWMLETNDHENLSMQSHFEVPDLKMNHHDSSFFDRHIDQTAMPGQNQHGTVKNMETMHHFYPDVHNSEFPAAPNPVKSQVPYYYQSQAADDEEEDVPDHQPSWRGRIHSFSIATDSSQHVVERPCIHSLRGIHGQQDGGLEQHDGDHVNMLPDTHAEELAYTSMLLFHDIPTRDIRPDFNVHELVDHGTYPNFHQNQADSFKNHPFRQ